MIRLAQTEPRESVERGPDVLAVYAPDPLVDTVPVLVGWRTATSADTRPIQLSEVEARSIGEALIGAATLLRIRRAS